MCKGMTTYDTLLSCCHPKNLTGSLCRPGYEACACHITTHSLYLRVALISLAAMPILRCVRATASDVMWPCTGSVASSSLHTSSTSTSNNGDGGKDQKAVNAGSHSTSNRGTATSSNCSTVWAAVVVDALVPASNAAHTDIASNVGKASNAEMKWVDIADCRLSGCAHILART